MDKEQFEQIMTLLKDIKKRVILLSFGIGITLGMTLSILLQKI